MFLNRRDPMIGYARYLSTELLSGATETYLYIKGADAIRTEGIREARAALLAYLASAHARNVKGVDYLWPHSEAGRMVADGICLRGEWPAISYGMVRDAIIPHIRTLRLFERDPACLPAARLEETAAFLSRFASAVLAREAAHVRGRGRTRRLAA